MKEDPLEQIAQDLWKKLGFPWNKIEKPTLYGTDITYWEVHSCPPKGTLECRQEPELGECDVFDFGPVEIIYKEERIELKIKSSYEGYAEPKGGILQYAIPSARYAELVERIKHAGPIGEKLLQQQRRGNPEIVRGVTWIVDLENLEGIGEFFYNFIKE